MNEATSSSTNWIAIGGWTVAAVIVLIALHNLGLWMERKGWVYYKYKKGSGTAASNVFVQIHSFIEPDVKAAIEALEEAGDEDRSGDDPDVKEGRPRAAAYDDTD